MLENKVIIEITGTGYTSTVKLGDKEYKETHRTTPMGMEGSAPFLEDEEAIPEDLSEAVHDMTVFNAMDVCAALREI
jgi:hypothetical protein